jgi:hypothetical protein
MSNPVADTTALAFSGTDIIEYRYAELLLNIAECYAAKGDIGNCITYLGKIRARVGIPSANNYGIGTWLLKYAAIEACLYERRVRAGLRRKTLLGYTKMVLYDGRVFNQYYSEYMSPNLVLRQSMVLTERLLLAG